MELLALPLLLSLMHLPSTSGFLFPFGVSRENSAFCALQNCTDTELRHIC